MIFGFLGVGAAVSAAMAFAWLVQYRTRNASWVDAIWSATTGLAGAALALLARPAAVWHRAAVAGLVVLWAARLASHIAGRAGHAEEDPRYSALRKQWGTRYEGRMFGFLQLQALIAFLLGIAVWFAARNPVDHVRILDMVGVVVLAIAVAGEGLADQQLKRFRADPANKGKICEDGLWGWSRHPNYFFEWLVWCGFACFAIDFSGAYPWGWGGLLGPVLMYLLLVHVSGVPLVEPLMLASRGAAFVDYQRRVNAFFPAPPHGHKEHAP